MIRATSKAGDLAGVLGGLPLGVVEVRRDGDDRLIDLVSEIGFGRFLQFPQDHGRDFGRRVFLVSHLHADILVRSADDLVGDDFLFHGHFAVPAAHEPLDGINGPRGIGNRLALGRLPDQDPAIGEGYHAGGKPVSLLIRDYFRLLALHDSDDREGSPQVDSDDFFTLSHHAFLSHTPAKP